MQLNVLSRPRLSGLRSVSVDASSWTELEACPICRREDRWRDLARIEGDPPGVVSSVCLDCRLGFLRRRPSRDWTERFYASGWDRRGRRASESAGMPAVPADPQALDFCRGELEPGARVLDVGAGFGGLLAAFREAGHPVAAVEPSSHRRRFLRSRMSIPAVDSLERAEAPFGLICAQHVLEHLDDPAAALARIRELLPDGGLLYLAVPDFWQEYPPQAFHFVLHPHWFTIESLERLLARAGFEIVRRRRQRDLRVLARKAAPSDPGPAGGKEFWEGVRRFVTRSCGGSSGRHLLIWYEDGSDGWWHYHRRVLPGWPPAGELIGGGLGMLERLPGRVRGPLVRRLPAWLRGHPRVLKVRLDARSGDFPLRVLYRDRSAPVWVK